MKPRDRRAIVLTAAFVAVLVAVLVVTHWSTVHDHVEAWHFQLTRETETFEPLPERTTRTPLTEDEWLQFAAERMGCWVIVDPLDIPSFHVGCVSENGIEHEALERRGWRVLEQRFPRRAYVVIRGDAIELQPILLDGPLILYPEPSDFEAPSASP